MPEARQSWPGRKEREELNQRSVRLWGKLQEHSSARQLLCISTAYWEPLNSSTALCFRHPRALLGLFPVVQKHSTVVVCGHWHREGAIWATTGFQGMQGNTMLEMCILGLGLIPCSRVGGSGSFFEAEGLSTMEEEFCTPCAVATFSVSEQGSPSLPSCWLTAPL